MDHLLKEEALAGESSRNGNLRTGGARLSLEQRSAVLALLCSLIALGGALLIAGPIQELANSAFFAGKPSSGIAVSPELLAQGSGFFAQSCADCHGDDAHGDEGPDLHGLAISNARIAAQIKNGTKGEMPSFAKKYHDPEIAALVAYVRSLR